MASTIKMTEEELNTILQNPVAVTINMMLGKIAPITFEQWQKVTWDMRYGNIEKLKQENEELKAKVESLNLIIDESWS